MSLFMAQSGFAPVKHDPSATHTHSPNRQAVRPRAFVLVIIQDGVRRELDLPRRGRVTLGRDEECDVLVSNGTLSRKHLVIETGERVTLTDLGSKNGTKFRLGDLVPHEPVEILVGNELIPGEIFEPGGLVCYIKGGDVEIRPGDERMPTAQAPLASSAAEAPGPVLLDPSMRRIYSLLERVAGGDISVMLLGETGVGKEVAARAVHAWSTRSQGAFVALNCAALSPSLLESELFGHEKGAFTGALAAKPGLLEVADGGTLFLDEVGEMPATVQATLLRVLEERAVLRVGALRPRPIDIRIVSATNRSLLEEIELGRFRKDLYFRLNGIAVEIPPLRDRPNEILPLARNLLRQCGAGVRTLSASAEAALLDWRWPGNVRELRNVIERAALLAGDGVIELEHLDLPAGAPRSSRSSAEKERHASALREELNALERDRILRALEASGGNQTRAAQALGMPRRTFIARLDAYGIPRPRRRP